MRGADPCRIAYQAIGHGASDLIFVPGFISNLELHWEEPGYARLLSRFAAFSRLIQFDKRGTGLSDRVDAAAAARSCNTHGRCARSDGRRRQWPRGLVRRLEGAPMSILFAATYPERTRSLVLYGGYAHFQLMGDGAAGAGALRRRLPRSMGHRRDAETLRAGPGRRPAFQAMVGALRAACRQARRRPWRLPG